MKKVFLLSLSLVLLIIACNAPPMYHTRAREFLQKKGVAQELIERLESGKTLTESEAYSLEKFNNIAVLHLLASNKNIPAALIERLAKHPTDDVRWGIAYNSSAPVELLLSMRKAGKYATINEYLARNPQLSQEVLREMYRNKEANIVSFGMNPNCPIEIMKEIARSTNDADRAWLASNPNLPEDIIKQLEDDPSELVKRFLSQNPTYKLRLHKKK